MADTRTAARRLEVILRVLQQSAPNQRKVRPALCSALEEDSSGVVRSLYLEKSPRELETAYSILCTDEAIHFVAELVATFDSRVEQLYWKRLKRKCAYQKSFQQPSFGISPGRHQEWKVEPVPARLQNRHLDLGDVSPSNIKHLVDSLLADVQGIQVDFDDGHCPTWYNQILGLYNIFRVIHGQIPGIHPMESIPILMLRPRAWNMTEHNMMVNGKEVPGALFDFGLLMYHNAKKLIETSSGPFFYLSKLEGAEEAELWNDIFIWSQKKLGIQRGTIKACVLIENILSSFEMDEILYALREHSLGLNCGIWDYAASIICKFGHFKDFILPDRNKYVNMERHFLKCYMKLVVQTCHRRGTYATGGMSALLLPSGNQPICDADIIHKVCEGKYEEIKQGVDGFLVYDMGLVPHLNELWKNHAPTENQLFIMHNNTEITADDLLEMPSGGITFPGIKHNIRVAILFIFHWFQGRGHFCYQGAVEDSATAEISRSQVWQWIRHEAPMEDDYAVVTKSLVSQLTDEFIKECLQGKHHFCKSDKDKHQMKTAAGIFMDIVTKKEFPDFITTYLNDSYIFWSFHKLYVRV